MAFFWRVQESPTFWGSDYEDYLVQQEAEASSLTRNLYQLVFQDPCEEIDLLSSLFPFLLTRPLRRRKRVRMIHLPHRRGAIVVVPGAR